MNELVTLRRNEPFTDSMLIAQRTDNQHTTLPLDRARERNKVE